MNIRLPACLCVPVACAWIAAAAGAVEPPAAVTSNAPPASPAVAPAVVPSVEVPTNGPIVLVPDVAPGASNGLITLNVDDTLISQILNAFSRQTGRSIVVGPDVTGRTTVRLTGVPWDAALDAVLKPFGYGHYTEGNATVVCGTDTLVPRVFALKYLDAADVEDLIRSALSPRGKFSKLIVRGQSWSATTEGGGTTMAGGNTMGKRQRGQENKDMAKTKTILVTDVSSSLDQIALLLGKVDRLPVQILIEARFLEANPRVLRDIGVEFGTGADGATTVGFKQGNVAYGVLGQQVSGGVSPGNFTPFSTPSMNSTVPFNAGLTLGFQRLSDTQLAVLLHLLQEDAAINVLSAPRILTLNNQEATIIVGTKYPIINSDASGGNGATATITTSLRGYEDIGIQLNVLPQICDGDSVALIVRPSVRELVGTKSGVSVSGSATALTEYPIISTREAETQVLLHNGQTIVIGGLLKDKQSRTTIKVPILGDIPLIGPLFRRQTDQNEKIDLLIFLTASIVAEGSSLVKTNLAGQVSGPFGGPVMMPPKGAPVAAPTVLSEPPPVTAGEPVVGTPAAAEACEVCPVAVETVPVALAPVPTPLAPGPVISVPVSAAPVVVPAADDELARAIERARAASARATDTAGAVRKGWGTP